MSSFSEVEQLKESEVVEETLPVGGYMTRKQETEEILTLKTKVKLLEEKLEEYIDANHTEK